MLWMFLEAIIIMIGAAAIFVIGWLLGRRAGTPIRRPKTELRGIGLEREDYSILDEALGTSGIDPSSWGKIKLGPLTEEDLAQIARRINENAQTQADTATLLLELKRIRLRDKP